MTEQLGTGPPHTAPENHPTGAETEAPRAGQAELRDVQLVRRVAEGDLRAFDALYRSYFPRLVRFLDRMTRNAALIEEIINDTMYVVWDKAGTYNQTSKVSTWIFSIAYRRACKSIRKNDLPVEQEFELVNQDAMNEPEGRLSQRQLQHRVAAALDSIPIEQRTVVNLTYYHGMDYQEIARTMDCPVNTVKTRMFHARRRLKELLSKALGS
jgi:RNA polymerase sigma factor (sigma-70 family)